LPADWAKRRKERFELDGFRCVGRTPEGRRCPAPAEECDHVGSKHDHSLENLRSLCKDCHQAHTQQQAAVARMKKRKEISGRFRRTEDHPGSVKK